MGFASRFTFKPFPATCRRERVSIISSQTGDGNNPFSQRAARKSVRISGARSYSLLDEKPPQRVFIDHSTNT
jgi:hypothetical protein